MLKSIHLILKDECKLDHTRLQVVGVSGGPDSLCLMDILHRLGYRLLVAHVNHRLRPEAAQEMLLVEQAAAQRGLQFASIEVDVLAHAERDGLTVEEAARRLRYPFLFEQAQKNDAQAVLVGHNADDQVETVLMHLLRGSGLTGLRGMPVRALPNTWSDEIPLLRPLLRTPRPAIEAYCQENGLHPVQDLTNFEPSYTRNRIRLELIPFLENYQPGVREHLLRLVRLIADEDDIINSLAEAAWQSCLLHQGERFVELNLPCLLTQPLALQRRMIRRAAELLRPGLTDVTFDDIERAVQFARHPSQTKQLDWMMGLRLSVEHDNLWLSGWEADLPLTGWPQLLPGQMLNLPLSGQADLSGGWVLHAEFVELDADGRQRVLLNRDPYQAWFDAARLESRLLLRSRQTGDQFAPLGMNGQRVSLKDWMIKQKLPQRARAGWPLLCSGVEIVWVPGFQPAHWSSLTSATRKILHLSLKNEIH